MMIAPTMVFTLSVSDTVDSAIWVLNTLKPMNSRTATTTGSRAP